MTDGEVTYAADEWKVLQVEDNPHVTNLVPNQRVDHYWRDMLGIETSDKKEVSNIGEDCYHSTCSSSWK